jgi:hypothetical protein
MEGGGAFLFDRFTGSCGSQYSTDVFSELKSSLAAEFFGGHRDGPGVHPYYPLHSYLSPASFPLLFFLTVSPIRARAVSSARHNQVVGGGT